MAIDFNQGRGFANEFAQEKKNSSDPDFAEFCREVDKAKTIEEEDIIVKKYEKLGVVN